MRSIPRSLTLTALAALTLTASAWGAPNSEFPTKQEGMHTIYLPHEGNFGPKTTKVLRIGTSQAFKLLSASPDQARLHDELQVSLDGRNYIALRASTHPVVAGPAWIRFFRVSAPFDSTAALTFALYNKYRFPAHVNY